MQTQATSSLTRSVQAHHFHQRGSISPGDSTRRGLFSSKLRAKESTHCQEVKHHHSQSAPRRKEQRKEPHKPQHKPKPKRPPTPQQASLNGLDRQLLSMLPPGVALGGGTAHVSQSLTASISPMSRLSSASLQKIVEHVQAGIDANGASMFQIDLKGDVLDGLKIKVSVLDGKVQAELLSEKPEIRRLLSANEQTLQKAMRDRGLVLSRLEIRDPKERQREQQRQQHQRDRQQAQG